MNLPGLRPALLLALALAALLALPAGAQDGETPPTDDEVNAIAKQLYCPVCENIPLDVCPTQACTQWRNTIREQLAAGRTEAEIKQYFVDQYGDRVLDSPPPTGLNWLIYILPPAAFLGGAYILFRAFRSWQRAPQPAAPGEPAAPETDPYVARLEEELRRRA